MSSDYRVESVVGEGTYGRVFKCTHLPSNQTVAVKKSSLNSTSGIHFTSIREIMILKQFGHHENLCELIDCYLEDGLKVLCVVMPFLTRDLKSMIADCRYVGFSVEQVCKIGIDISKGLSVLHEHFYLHRDLTPANVLYDGKNFKVCDYGMCRLINPHIKDRCVKINQTNADQFETNPFIPLSQHMVTLWYRPPELLFDTPYYTFSVDSWSLGVILAELLQVDPSFKKKSCLSFNTQPDIGRGPLFKGVSSESELILEILKLIGHYESDMENWTDEVQNLPNYIPYEPIIQSDEQWTEKYFLQINEMLPIRNVIWGLTRLNPRKRLKTIETITEFEKILSNALVKKRKRQKKRDVVGHVVDLF